MPEITSILALPAIGTTIRDPAQPNQVTNTVFVGIVVEGTAISWGTCAISPGEFLPGQPLSFEIEQVISTVETVVAPVLVGQRLTNFRELATSIETLRETIAFREVVVQAEETSPGFSRREIISGFLSSPDQAAPPTVVEETTIERLLHPLIRFGVSQALLAAVAGHRQLTMAEVIAEEFELPFPTSAVPIQMAIHRGQTLHLTPQLSALGYATGGSDPEKSLGLDGERIQRFVRQLRQQIAGAKGHRPIAIHLDLGGGLGQLYGGDVGKILGTLYGLEQAASPGPIYVTDPLILDSREEQIETMAKLNDYLKMRGMSLQLVAGEFINSFGDVEAFIQARAAQMFHLSMAQLGSIQETVLAIQACRANDLGVLLAGNPPEVVAQVALATQPGLLVNPSDRPGDGGLNLLHNEMTRTLAWLIHKG